MERRDLTFRVFVSSTFSDLKAERNALQQVTFPKLREYLCLLSVERQHDLLHRAAEGGMKENCDADGK